MHKFDKHEKYNNIIKTIFLFQLTVAKKTKNKIPKEIKTIAPKPTNKKKKIILL